MRPILIDTNAYAAFKRGDGAIVAVLQHAPSLLICTTVLGELLAGFAAGSRELVNRSELTQFLQSPRVNVVASTAATADLYALVRLWPTSFPEPLWPPNPPSSKPACRSQTSTTAITPTTRSPWHATPAKPMNA